MTDALEAYLQELHVIHASTAAVKETSGYGALASLLNAYGDKLKPKVHCIIQLRNDGAGLPDGGLFTPDQLKNTDEEAPLRGIPLPSRGVIEVKSADADLNKIAETDQVRDYVKRYGLVLLTNYWRFILLRRSDNSSPIRAEHFQLAENEAGFWQLAGHPRKGSQENGQQFAEYIKRVLLHRAALDNPRDVAFFLASYARDARARVEKSGDLPALQAIRAALEEALGMKFEAERGEHFFRSTLVQTLFYGVFSAWVLWHKEKPLRKSDFDWKSAAWTLHVPMIKALFEQVATPTKLGPLQLVEVLDWTADALNRVERLKFFERFIEDHAVQYFYEPFLAAFDPELRKELGVWYTPPEIVQYQVARVDTALREELDIPDGLADPRVFVLDPCCGTGAYLVEVLRKIGTTLSERGEGEAITAADIKKAAQHRVFGFELLPAPFVVAHLQMGLLLQKLGAPLDTYNERAAIYLTNALTGWEPPSEDAKKQLTFAIPEFQQEKEAADDIKQEKRIIVIVGNPPYNGFAGVAVEEERDLTNAYRSTKKAPPPQGQGLNDLYVRFYRMAERRIVERSGEGIVCFISNYSWLDGLSFTGMREKYLEEFDSITIDCLNGDKYKTGKLTPDGQPDPSVFSTDENREGIQVGTAIATLIRTKRAGESENSRKKRKQAESAKTKRMLFRHFWGKQKRADLLKSLTKHDNPGFTAYSPDLELGLPFIPGRVFPDFFEWPQLPQLFPVSFPGVKTSRDEFLVSLTREPLLKRVQAYFDPSITDDEIRRLAPCAMEDAARFDARAVRGELCRRGFLKNNIVRYCYRPFDVRWLYWDPDTKLLDEKRSEYFAQVFERNIFFVAQQKPRRDWSRPQLIRSIGCLDLMDRGASCFPLLLKPDTDPSSLFDHVADKKPHMNLTQAAKEYLASLRLGNKQESLFYHALAILHAPCYAAENGGALRQDWPRIPLPAEREQLVHSVECGKQVAELLDTESIVQGVTAGKVRPELVNLAVLTRKTKEELNLSVSVGWGRPGQDGVTMPGKGKLTQAVQGAADGPDSFWSGFCDVYLNESVCWSHVPVEVWDYTIGGYQVIKKWLSYRDDSILKRSLTPDEAREVTHMARRIAALILLQPDLDKNYAAIKASAANWSDFTA